MEFTAIEGTGSGMNFITKSAQHTAASRGQDKPALSICIPTYNRSQYLKSCIESIAVSTRGQWNEIELIVSDNASTDDTPLIVEEMAAKYPIVYHRNAVNIGGENNFYAAATYATAEHVWIFSDDDEFCPSTITEVLKLVRQDFDLVVLNFSTWDRDMVQKTNPARIPVDIPRVLCKSEDVLLAFGLHMTFISSVIFRKDIYFSVPSTEYERFTPFGLPQTYSLYCGILDKGRFAFVPEPVFKQRGDNCLYFQGPEACQRLIKTFIHGPALLFEALQVKGYRQSVIRRSKNQHLRTYFPVRLLLGKTGEIKRMKLISEMSMHYRNCSQFWLTWVPVLLIPPMIANFSLNIARLLFRHSRSTASI